MVDFRRRPKIKRILSKWHKGVKGDFESVTRRVYEGRFTGIKASTSRPSAKLFNNLREFFEVVDKLAMLKSAGFIVRCTQN